MKTLETGNIKIHRVPGQLTREAIFSLYAYTTVLKSLELNYSTFKHFKHTVGSVCLSSDRIRI
jgi:hypothetical protein